MMENLTKEGQESGQKGGLKTQQWHMKIKTKNQAHPKSLLHKTIQIFTQTDPILIMNFAFRFRTFAIFRLFIYDTYNNNNNNGEKKRNDMKQ